MKPLVILLVGEGTFGKARRVSGTTNGFSHFYDPVMNDFERALDRSFAEDTQSTLRPGTVYMKDNGPRALLNWAQDPPAGASAEDMEIAEQIEGHYDHNYVGRDYSGHSAFADQYDGPLPKGLNIPGAIIPCDHIRPIAASSCGRLVVCGIGPTRKKRRRSRGIVRRMRDFYGPLSWEPHSKYHWVQDETGWCEPNEYGDYDASRRGYQIRKFQKILTIRPENIYRIDWGLIS